LKIAIIIAAPTNDAIIATNSENITNTILNINIIMFTDGEDPTLSSSNIEENFESLKVNGEFNFKMDTVGFGPDANTELLVKATIYNNNY
jgi:hypothetical protein